MCLKCANSEGGIDRLVANKANKDYDHEKNLEGESWYDDPAKSRSYRRAFTHSKREADRGGRRRSSHVCEP
jgi:hypothetical protein